MKITLALLFLSATTPQVAGDMYGGGMLTEDVAEANHDRDLSSCRSDGKGCSNESGCCSGHFGLVDGNIIVKICTTPSRDRMLGDSLSPAAMLQESKGGDANGVDLLTEEADADHDRDLKICLPEGIECSHGSEFCSAHCGKETTGSSVTGYYTSWKCSAEESRKLLEDSVSPTTRLRGPNTNSKPL